MIARARTFIPSAEVAHRIGMSRASFMVKRQQLEADHGFPQPMPNICRPLLWRADQIAEWIDRHGRPRDIEDRVDPALLATGRVRILAEARRA